MTKLIVDFSNFAEAPKNFHAKGSVDLVNLTK